MSKDNQKMTGDSVYRVKMYKDGKKWVYAGATTLALAAGLVFANVNASADTTNNGSAEPQQEQVVTNSDAGSVSQNDQQAAPATAEATQTPVKTDAAAPAQPAAETPATPAAASVSQAAPVVSAPASDAEVTVSTPASVTVTSNASSQATSTAATPVASGAGEVKKDSAAQAVGATVDGTQFNAEAGKNYNVQVTLTKNSDVDWSNTTGQFSIKGNVASDTGTWKLASYVIGGKTTTLTDNEAAAMGSVNYSAIGDNDSVILNYVYNAVTSSPTGGLTFTDVPDANAETDVTKVGWNYTTTVTTDDNTTTPVADTDDVNVYYFVVVGVNADGTPNVKRINGTADDAAAEVVQNGEVGGTYTITPADLAGYTYIPQDQTNAQYALTGTLAKGGAHVALMYMENTGLTTKYQTADGSTVAADQNFVNGADGTLTRAGGTYEVTAPKIDGYNLVGYKIGDDVTARDASDVAKGTLAAGNNNVTFVYEAVPAEKATVTVNYVDAAGNEISPATSTEYTVGDPYTVETPEIAGYEYTSAVGDLEGTVAGNTTITLTYTKDATPVDKATVTVNYLDEAGNVIKAATSTEYAVGDTYNVDTPKIDGYSYVSANADLSGEVAGDSTINLTYKANAVDPVKTGTVTVKYVDENGDEIQPSTSSQYNVGDSYSVDTPAINGYTYKEADGDLSGTVAGDTVLTLTYGKNGASTTAPTTAPTDPDVSDPDTINPGEDNNNGGTTTAPATTPDTDTTASGDTLTATDNGTAGVVPTNTVLKPVVSSADQATKKSDATTLPQTDEENGTALAVLGLSTLVMGSALFFGATKRRKHQA
ncbi:MucBP domain-containing protein [Lactiplantibacillus daoliensis]|uniref:MucBP domain-containing protein n=1 Tax=Lactiplantibacillus daoliensis TaxID=2559916 RepID=A0ABW1UHS6_9LACO|nr:MucBP domain-containing protein [Lactiplantibacillus daoliensis]